MKKGVLICLILSLMINLSAQNNESIVLNPPSKDRGKTVIDAMWNRASPREFDTKKISHQDLSDLLWAANGINRPEEGKRTAPSAMNAQDVDVFVFNETGVYIYNAQKHSLDLVVKGDHRKIFSGPQDDSYPPLLLLLVSDISRFRVGDDALKLEWAAIDTGIVAQNILLFCTSIDMVGRPRAFMNKESIKELLSLNEKQYPILNIPVAYKKD
ncbi:MAG: SagB/ThcOx family dehydrogenase [Fermentimonas sp.]|nr:SagB/ThcOx family dehydrogenase [Fermentimonas sp.]MDD4698509.1 SagB/ThcOx family dehydrogenase [Fermentimonas sp.]